MALSEKIWFKLVYSAEHLQLCGTVHSYQGCRLDIFFRNNISHSIFEYHKWISMSVWILS